MSDTTKQKKGASTFWWVLAFSFLVFAFFYLLEPERTEIPQDQLPWNSYFDSSGQLHALGVVVNGSSVQEVVDLYEEEFEFRIFSEKDETNKSLEVQLPKIHIGSIRGALFLKLKLEEIKLNEIYSRGVETTVTQSGLREVTPFNEDTEALKFMSFYEMTFIPRKNLNERAIKMRFGEPDSIEDTQDKTIQRWVYSEKGLKVLFNTDGPEAFIYTK